MWEIICYTIAGLLFIILYVSIVWMERKIIRLRYQIDQLKKGEGRMSEYEGFEKEKINADPVDSLAWSISQILDDDAPLRWHRH